MISFSESFEVGLRRKEMRDEEGQRRVLRIFLVFKRNFSSLLIALRWMNDPVKQSFQES